MVPRFRKLLAEIGLCEGCMLGKKTLLVHYRQESPKFSEQDLAVWQTPSGASIARLDQQNIRTCAHY